jgi:hypothetical protein
MTQARFAGWACYRAGGCAVLVAALLASGLVAQTPPTRDALEVEIDTALAGMDAALEKLDRLRVKAGRRDEAVAAIVDAVSAALGDIDARLVEALDGQKDVDPAKRVLVQKTAERRWRLRSRRCRVAICRGELHVRAGEALPAGLALRRRYLATAGETFRNLRVAYARSPLALAGYIGEARALRAAGDLAGADQALEAVLKKPKRIRDEAAMTVYRTAVVEKLETQLLADPDAAETQCLTLAKTSEFRNVPGWLSRLQWAAVRAKLIRADRFAKADADADARHRLAEEALMLLRAGGVIAVAPRYKRLSLLAIAERLAGADRLTRGELLDWADAQARAGHLAAAEFYQRALAMSGDALSAEQLAGYATLMWRRGDAVATAEACDRFLGAVAADHRERETMLQLRAVALLRQFKSPTDDSPPAALSGRLLTALEAVVESGLPIEVRRDALRQWVALSARRGSFGVGTRLIAKHPDLGGDDPYLLYAEAAGRWQALAAKLAAGRVKETDAGETVRRVLRLLVDAEKRGQGAKALQLVARSALLRAQILAAPPTRDTRAALEVINQKWTMLKAERATAESAAWLRVELMMDLGLVDAATAAVAELQGEGMRGRANVSLRLAEALARRYEAAELRRRGEVQRQTVSLCNRAVSQATRDETAFVAAARRAARALLTVQAGADAEALARKLLQTDSVRGDRNATLRCSLMLAEALTLGNAMNEAHKVLSALAVDYPRSVDAHLALGRCYTRLRRPGKAVETFREARRISRPGTVPWCRATLALAEGLQAQRHARAAGDILRVSQALYPEFGNAELMAELRQLEDLVRDAVAREGTRRR